MECPTCNLPLVAANVGGHAFERCGQCSGEYFRHSALESLLSERAAPAGSGAAAYRRPSPLSDPVRYRKCPSCGEMMLRRNFRETSGVVVDVCAVDGIWLDRGELATLIDFASSGALGVAERRLVERAAARKRLDAWASDLRALGPRHYVGGHGVMFPIDGIANLDVLPGPDRDED